MFSLTHWMIFSRLIFTSRPPPSPMFVVSQLLVPFKRATRRDTRYVVVYQFTTTFPRPARDWEEKEREQWMVVRFPRVHRFSQTETLVVVERFAAIPAFSRLSLTRVICNRNIARVNVAIGTQWLEWQVRGVRKKVHRHISRLTPSLKPIQHFSSFALLTTSLEVASNGRPRIRTITWPSRWRNAWASEFDPKVERQTHVFVSRNGDAHDVQVKSIRMLTESLHSADRKRVQEAAAVAAWKNRFDQWNRSSSTRTKWGFNDTDRTKTQKMTDTISPMSQFPFPSPWRVGARRRL